MVQVLVPVFFFLLPGAGVFQGAGVLGKSKDTGSMLSNERKLKT
jgi:hypothetical protein